jgi:hypothetical protein
LDIDNVDGYRPDKVAACQDEIQRVITANMHLSRLTIYSNLIEHIPLRLFENIIEFEVWCPKYEHVKALERLLPHGERLERFAMVELTSCHVVAPMLLSHATDMPCLTSLKIMSLDAMHEEQTVVDLAAFIGLQKRLRRQV